MYQHCARERQEKEEFWLRQNVLQTETMCSYMQVELQHQVGSGPGWHKTVFKNQCSALKPLSTDLSVFFFLFQSNVAYISRMSCLLSAWKTTDRMTCYFCLFLEKQMKSWLNKNYRKAKMICRWTGSRDSKGLESSHKPQGPHLLWNKASFVFSVFTPS